MLLHEIVDASGEVGATRSRKAKVAALAGVLARVSLEEPDEVETVVSYLAGSLRQRRTGVGWRSLTLLPPPVEESEPGAATTRLGVTEVHRAFEHLAGLAGPGSQAARTQALADLFSRATAPEQAWLRGLVTGEVRQGALDSLVQEALAVASATPLVAVRRAAMMTGSTVAVARAALGGGEEALAAYTLEVGRPVLPMLASSATDVAEALTKAAGAAGGAVAVETKLDGIRIQVHRDGDRISIATRSLDDITARLPEVVAVVAALPARRVVLDGEALALDGRGRPRPFQETASRTATAAGPTDGTAQVHVTPYFFDVLHLDGDDLLDAPGAERAAVLASLVPAEHRTARLVTDDPVAAADFAARAVAEGHEGVVVKSLTATYDAGRRGAGWVKVKPVHTLDLVVLAVEWGSGRRRGLLSNLHLGARVPDDTGDGSGFVMLGKTFKGLTDEVLAWQTERFLALETSRTDHVVHVRPEQVVEIAVDGLQRSTRYPGGVALRFARVVRYRDDKTAAEADTLDEVRALGAEPAPDDVG